MMVRFSRSPNRLDQRHLRSESVDQVAVYSITKVSTGSFTKLYIRLTLLFFIQSGSKHVGTPLVGSEADRLIFQPGRV